ncbi:MAG: hypothetical protein JWO31_853 [Phycisphaerales bacterium]|nr:hypothetical protein [Phycisphaerales bacterium]
MSRLPRDEQLDAPAGRMTGEACCHRAVSAPATTGWAGWSGMSWAYAYQFAYAAAVEQVAAADRRRRQLGHVAPSMN